MASDWFETLVSCDFFSFFLSFFLLFSLFLFLNFHPKFCTTVNNHTKVRSRPSFPGVEIYCHLLWHSIFTLNPNLFSEPQRNESRFPQSGRQSSKHLRKQGNGLLAFIFPLTLLIGWLEPAESAVTLLLGCSISKVWAGVICAEHKFWRKSTRKFVICMNSGRFAGSSAQQDCKNGAISCGMFSTLGLSFWKLEQKSNIKVLQPLEICFEVKENHHEKKNKNADDSKLWFQVMLHQELVLRNLPLGM